MRRNLTVTITAAFVLGLAACGGNGGSDNSPTDTSMLTKNAVLNKCVSIISGGRPSRPQTKEELQAQREAELAAMPPECRPSRGATTTTVKKP